MKLQLAVSDVRAILDLLFVKESKAGSNVFVMIYESFLAYVRFVKEHEIERDVIYRACEFEIILSNVFFFSFFLIYGRKFVLFVLSGEVYQRLFNWKWLQYTERI